MKQKTLVAVEAATWAIVCGGLSAIADTYTNTSPNSPIEPEHLKRAFITGALIAVVALFRKKPGSEQ